MSMQTKASIDSATLGPWTSARIVLCLWTSSTTSSTIFHICPCQSRHCRNIAVFIFFSSPKAQDFLWLTRRLLIFRATRTQRTQGEENQKQQRQAQKRPALLFYCCRWQIIVDAFFHPLMYFFYTLACFRGKGNNFLLFISF